MSTGLADQPDLPLGRATLRPATCELSHDGGVASLEPQVMRALLALARNTGRVVSRDRLVELAWDGRAVSEDAINRVISRIRRLSETTGAFRLITLRKVGYRIEVADPAGAPTGEPTGEPQKARTPPRVRPASRLRAAWIVALVLMFAAGLGVALWRSQPHGPARETAAAAPTLAVAPLTAATPDEAKAQALTAQLRTTLSHMRGLRLVDRPGGAKPDLVLSGALTGGDPQPVVSLTLNDQRSGVRIWSASFDGRGIPDPTVEERAVSSVARYLAIWLGDRMSGEPAAREPANPEVTRIVAGAQRTLAAAHEARHNRDWALFARLVRETVAARDQALAIDPTSAEALMLGYQIEGVPEFRRPDETQALYEARRRRAAQLLARALAANPDEPQALAATAHEFSRNMRWDDAGKLLERAVAVNPNSADANTWYAYHLGLVGQCEAGLRHARIAAGLSPGQTWRQMAVPRLLHCAGRLDEAERGYRDLLAKDPGNVFVLRDAYLLAFATRQPARLRNLAAYAKDGLWHGAPPAPVGLMIRRISLAADALEGRPKALLALVDADAQALDGPIPGGSSFGSNRGDQMFALALEYAEAGAEPQGMETLRQAVEAGSLYFPWALPSGPTEFPAALRADPAYGALWKSTPGLVSLMARRAAARR
jgi:DNA-binding winged helix-turn-helix (wHTH) protein/tetratricopeptide (TPR) repeat protein